MPAYARREIVPGDEVGVYHCMRGASGGRSFAASIPSRETTTSIARTGLASGLSNWLRFRGRYLRLCRDEQSSSRPGSEDRPLRPWPFDDRFGCSVIGPR